jgi:hypothetical protein
LSDELAASLEAAWGRFFLGRLDVSAELVDSGGRIDCDNSVQSLPAHLQFQGLALAAQETLPWGNKGYAQTFEEARDLFNACLPHLREALQLYVLDGCVTEHVQLLFDVSKAYSCASLFVPLQMFGCLDVL